VKNEFNQIFRNKSADKLKH